MNNLSVEELEKLLPPYQPGWGMGRVRDYERPSLGGWLFIDVPPASVKLALEAFDPSFRTFRPNGQPPATWLIDRAETYNGALGGVVGTANSIRIDTICVPIASFRPLVSELYTEFNTDESDAFALALGCVWERWDADEPTWQVFGEALAIAVADPSYSFPGEVGGLWWD